MYNMKKEKIKLNQGDQVLYWDGKSIMDLTKVDSVDKTESSATLTNGIKCNRVSKDGILFERYRGKSFTGWIRKYEGDALILWEGYLKTREVKNQVNVLSHKINIISIRDVVDNLETCKNIINISKILKKL